MYSIDNLNIHNKLNKFIVFSIALHVAFILLFTYKWYTNIRQSSKSIDITLVHQSSKYKPKDVDYLAQKSQQGGGNQNKKNNPSVTQSALFPNQQAQDITKKVEEQLSKPLMQSLAKQNNALTTKAKSKSQINSNKDINDSKDTTEIMEHFNLQIESIPEFTSLLRNIEQRKRLYAKRPKKRFITAATSEYRDAEYLDTWRRKLELIGNQYYPQQARRRDLSGKVLLLVSIKANGQLDRVVIERSSGIKVLDDAAVQTIHLAAPFKPFTKEMKKDTDIIEIIRTWSFNEDNIDNLAIT